MLQSLLRTIFYFTTSILIVVSAENPSDESRLITKIFTDYKKAIRPASTPTAPVQVTFDLVVRQIIDFDEKNQVITWNVWVRQAWQDYRLKWNQSEYAVDWLTLNPTSIWVPDIYLYNNAQEYYRGFDYDIEDSVYIRPNGRVYWATQVIIKSTCTFSVRYFPFDEQNCSVQFGSWTHSGNHLNLSLAALTGDLGMTAENGEWLAVDFKAVRNVVYYSCCPEPYPSVTYTLTARRRCMFYIYSFMIPCILIAFLSVLAFCLPYKSGERVTLLITSLLSLTVFSVMISDMTPQNLDGTPLFSQFMIAILAEISIAIVFICLIIDVEGKSSTPPRFIRIFINEWLARLFLLRSESYEVKYNRKIMDASTLDQGKYVHKENGIAVLENRFTEEKFTTDTTFDHDSPLDVLSYNEEEDEKMQNIGQYSMNCSREFKEKLLHVLKGLGEESKEELRNIETAHERQQLAWAMDKLLHAFFVLVVMITMGFILLTPPEVNL